MVIKINKPDKVTVNTALDGVPGNKNVFFLDYSGQKLGITPIILGDSHRIKTDEPVLILSNDVSIRKLESPLIFIYGNNVHIDACITQSIWVEGKNATFVYLESETVQGKVHTEVKKIASNSLKINGS